jgi:hypothetical protein
VAPSTSTRPCEHSVPQLPRAGRRRHAPRHEASAGVVGDHDAKTDYPRGHRRCSGDITSAPNLMHSYGGAFGAPPASVDVATRYEGARGCTHTVGTRGGQRRHPAAVITRCHRCSHTRGGGGGSSRARAVRACAPWRGGVGSRPAAPPHRTFPRCRRAVRRPPSPAPRRQRRVERGGGEYGCHSCYCVHFRVRG